jgi:hypothetical protein
VMAAGDDRREERLVKNELAFAAFNERRRDVEAGNPDEPVAFVCECANEECFQVLNVTPHDWQAAHSRGDQFVVWPGHVFPEVEMVVDRTAGYWIVRKYALPLS